MTPLGDRIAALIAQNGPITIADYMALCLGDPEHGYYMARQPFGRGGDFVTAPEVSQVFGELIGLWAVATWQAMGGPSPFILAELGPGRGTLMADLLRAAKLRPAFAGALELHLVETSPVLRAAQARALAAVRPVWHDDVAELPEGPLLLVANEFLDALPIRQLVKTETGWHEKLIGLSAEADSLAFALSPGPAPSAALVPAELQAAPPGSVCEISPASLAVADTIARRVVAEGGAALFIDYGHVKRGCADTLQAVRRHQRHDPLDDPGEADLTAHVDFAALAEIAAADGATIWGPVTQGHFLQGLGIAARVERLLAGATPGQAADIGTACRRLIDPAEMGTLFKVLCIAGPTMPAPAGFTPEVAERRPAQGRRT